eukprot:4237252-Pyramimonas_sp.AAC.1
MRLCRVPTVSVDREDLQAAAGAPRLLSVARLTGHPQPLRPPPHSCAWRRSQQPPRLGSCPPREPGALARPQPPQLTPRLAP